ncbi:ACP S-malonyltransferase [Merismopedia glauca]|uniref:ACP S-malonyltransferase n=1 Tax=Merismopedia glauca TaxID=292586 RepID=UPI001FE2FCA3|nr:ACP S-malonyltransferase [Merismopedia glauca]
MKTAWVFPGQGSQKLGMGADLLETEVGQAKFAQAAEILGWSVPETCQGDEEKLSQTLYTQPSLYVIESILVDLLRHGSQSPDLVAGHSLGEYVALYAAGVLDFTTGLKLVKRRAELMNQAAGGTMAALMGFKREDLLAKIAETPDVVLANDNSAAQVVISGTPEAVDEVLSAVKTKRSVKLKVSGAFHSHLMAPAAAEFSQILEEIEFHEAKVPVLSNVEPIPTTDSTVLKERLQKQMTGSVRWLEISLELPNQGINRVVEVGPGQVLTGLIKRTCEGLELVNISSVADLAT